MTLINTKDGLSAVVSEIVNPKYSHKVVLRDADADEVFAEIFGSREQCEQSAREFVFGLTGPLRRGQNTTA